MTLLGIDASIDVLGRLGDRAANATAGPIAGHGEGMPLPSLPRLLQSMREEWQSTRFTLDLTNEEVDKAGLDGQACLSSRRLDGITKVVLLQRTEQMQPLLDQTGERLMRDSSVGRSP